PPTRRQPRPTLFPYTTLFRSAQPRIGERDIEVFARDGGDLRIALRNVRRKALVGDVELGDEEVESHGADLVEEAAPFLRTRRAVDRKSTRLNSSHDQISYAVF